jgi:riboflavin synthase alpha subunit
MHRLLIAYETTGIVVWSLNKNQALTTLRLSEKVNNNGPCLTVEWYNTNQFIAGFQDGTIEVYKQGS